MFATRDEPVVDAKPVSDAKLISQHGFNKEYLDVEFNITMVNISEESIQQAHPRARVSLEQA